MPGVLERLSEHWIESVFALCSGARDALRIGKRRLRPRGASIIQAAASFQLRPVGSTRERANKHWRLHAAMQEAAYRRCVTLGSKRSWPTHERTDSSRFPCWLPGAFSFNLSPLTNIATRPCMLPKLAAHSKPKTKENTREK